MRQVQRYAFTFHRWLNQPKKVFVTCFFILLISLFLNGTVWKVWGLYRDQTVIKEQIAQASASIQTFDQQMLRAKDSTYIEHLAHDKMDLVSENDLVFVFPE